MTEEGRTSDAEPISDAPEQDLCAEDLLHAFLDGLPMPAWAVDESCRLMYVNSAWQEFTGRDLEQERGEGWLDGILAEDRADLRRSCRAAVTGRAAFTIDFQLRRDDGHYRWLTCYGSPFTAPNGQVCAVVGMCMDLTERKQREEQLAFMATHDSLTGLPNRRMFEDTLGRAVERARRGEHGAMLLIDMDNFKSYNDSLGHLEGDQALINFALLLQRHLRSGDLLARIGGDEFAVLLERVGVPDAVDIAERMRRAVAAEDFVAHARVHELGMSAGLLPVDGTLDARTLFDVADAAMYEAKEAGRNRVIVRRPGVDVPAEPRERMATRVRDAIADKRFRLHYQPVVYLYDGSVAYYESLVRMIDRDGAALLPVEFLSTAERLGLMPRLTRIVVDLILQALAEHPDARLSLNIAGTDLTDESLPRFIEEELRTHNLDPHRLVIETAEDVVVRNIAGMHAWMDRLRSLGVTFVLDEFGAGLGLFGLLKDLSFEQVKLDGSIVRSLAANGDSRAFVYAVRNLVESQGSVAVASWVETGNLLDKVREIGFSLGQGYELEMPDPDLGRLIERYGARDRRRR
ncbi:MAG: EAL domain-containing protein [Coriobacteriia bacterium]|nr:EAL domain-containing protein [Coriobacteriia bacterium]